MHIVRRHKPNAHLLCQINQSGPEIPQKQKQDQTLPMHIDHRHWIDEGSARKLALHNNTKQQYNQSTITYSQWENSPSILLNKQRNQVQRRAPKWQYTQIPLQLIHMQRI